MLDLMCVHTCQRVNTVFRGLVLVALCVSRATQSRGVALSHHPST